VTLLDTIKAKAAEVRKAGLACHTLALTNDARATLAAVLGYDPLGRAMYGAKVMWANRASSTVLWGYDAKRHRLIPYVVQ
jgi:hypothetical protein